MSTDLMSTLRAIVRDEMSRVRQPELGVVTQTHAREDDSNDGNHQVSLALCASGVELQRVPIAVSRAGWSALPNEGDLLLVNFVGGDLNAPVVVGSLYSDQAHPPVAKAHEIVYLAPDDDDSSLRRMHFELANGNTFTIKDETLEVVMGGTTVTLNKDGDIEIKAAGNISFSADGDFSLKASGSVSIEAQSDLKLKGTSSATLEGTATTTVKGGQISLAGVTQFNPA
ncbi:MAG: phage baseplate assembly protein V [bacterium]